MSDIAHTKRPGPGPGIALAFSVLAVSSGAIFVRIAEAPALVISAYRVGIAALVLAPFALMRRRSELASLARRDLWLVLASGLFLAMHFATWIASLSRTSVASSTVLVNTIPLWVGILSPLFLADRMGRGMIAAIVLSVVGTAILGAGDFFAEGHALEGDLLALAGGLCAALYLMLGRAVRARLSLVTYAFVCYGTAAIALWGVVLATGLPVTGYSNTTFLAFLGLAFVSQLMGHTTYNWALKWFSAGVVAVVLLGEPVCSTFFAWVLLHEGPGVTTACGGAVVICAIYLAAREGGSAKVTPEGDRAQVD